MVAERNSGMSLVHRDVAIAALHKEAEETKTIRGQVTGTRRSIPRDATPDGSPGLGPTSDTPPGRRARRIHRTRRITARKTTGSDISLDDIQQACARR